MDFASQDGIVVPFPPSPSSKNSANHVDLSTLFNNLVDDDDINDADTALAMTRSFSFYKHKADPLDLSSAVNVDGVGVQSLSSWMDDEDDMVTNTPYAPPSPPPLNLIQGMGAGTLTRSSSVPLSSSSSSSSSSFSSSSSHSSSSLSTASSLEPLSLPPTFSNSKPTPSASSSAASSSFSSSSSLSSSWSAIPLHAPTPYHHLPTIAELDTEGDPSISSPFLVPPPKHTMGSFDFPRSTASSPFAPFSPLSSYAPGSPSSHASPAFHSSTGEGLEYPPPLDSLSLSSSFAREVEGDSLPFEEIEGLPSFPSLTIGRLEDDEEGKSSCLVANPASSSDPQVGQKHKQVKTEPFDISSDNKDSTVPKKQKVSHAQTHAAVISTSFPVSSSTTISTTTSTSVTPLPIPMATSVLVSSQEARASFIVSTTTISPPHQHQQPSSSSSSHHQRPSAIPPPVSSVTLALPPASGPTSGPQRPVAPTTASAEMAQAKKQPVVQVKTESVVSMSATGQPPKKRQRRKGPVDTDTLALRRAKHNQVEIRRRQRIASTFNELQNLVSCQQSNKGVILQAAIDKLKWYQSRIVSLQSRNSKDVKPMPATGAKGGRGAAAPMVAAPPSTQPAAPPVATNDEVPTILNKDGFYDGAFLHSGAAIIILSLSGVLVDCNDSFANLVGSSRARLRGVEAVELKALATTELAKKGARKAPQSSAPLHIKQLLASPAAVSAFNQGMNQLIRNELQTSDAIHSLLRQDGGVRKEFPVKCMMWLIKETASSAPHIYCVVTPVSDNFSAMSYAMDRHPVLTGTKQVGPQQSSLYRAVIPSA